MNSKNITSVIKLIHRRCNKNRLAAQIINFCNLIPYHLELESLSLTITMVGFSMESISVAQMHICKLSWMCIHVHVSAYNMRDIYAMFREKKRNMPKHEDRHQTRHTLVRTRWGF